MTLDAAFYIFGGLSNVDSNVVLDELWRVGVDPNSTSFAMNRLSVPGQLPLGEQKYNSSHSIFSQLDGILL